MSLYGALFSGVSGLTSQSNKIGAISDNISNVNTVGYKSTEGLFQSLVTGGGSASTFSPGGVLGTVRNLVDQQGLLTSTGSSTDIAISGSGFFVVNQASDASGQVLYTRAGSFTQDSVGNFRNAAGFYLQAWPLDREGRLPGEPGNLNTTSSANLASLETVNVQSLTGTAASTSTVSLGANLNAGQSVYPGAAGEATLDIQDSANYPLTASGVLIPTAINSLTRGDRFTVATGGGLSYAYEYGGLTFSRVVTSGAAGDDAVTALGNGQTTLTTAAVNLGANPVSTTTAGDAFVTITTAAAHGLQSGDVVTLADITGVGNLIDNIPIAEINGTHVITVTSTTTFTIATTTTAQAGGASGGGNTPATFTTQELKTTSGSGVVRVRQTAHGFSDGQVVTLSGVSATLAGITATQLNSTFVIDVIDANHYDITTAGTASSTTGGGTGTIIADSRPFAGQILDADTATETFLGVTGTASFTAAGLTFTITTGDGGTSTFTYTASSPNAQLGQFNTLTNLATAISAVNGLTARVENNRLYVSAINASDFITFANGSVVGTDGPPVQAGIDWVGELGVANVTVGTNRFSTLQGLADLVNDSAGLSASIANPLSTAVLSINVDDPLDTITFTDEVYGVGDNTGSPLAALGLIDSLASVAPSAGAGETTGAIGPAYDPADSTKNMASGAITAQFSRPIQVYDSLGAAHTLNMAFIKTGVNTWAAEIYSIPDTDVTTSNPDGIVAFGTITFNGDGSLFNVGTGLTDPDDIVWNNGAVPSSIDFDFGTAGQPFGTVNAAAIGLTDGMSQFNSSYRVNFANQNGAPVGELTGVAIDEDGFIVASYNNGETQRIFRIPLADFAAPNEMRSISGNVFAQTSTSGEVNLIAAGGSGVGKISSGSLEASNVELADQLTDMIVAQRAYQANTRVISTADSLLEDLNRILQ